MPEGGLIAGVVCRVIGGNRCLDRGAWSRAVKQLIRSLVRQQRCHSSDDPSFCGMRYMHRHFTQSGGRARARAFGRVAGKTRAHTRAHTHTFLTQHSCGSEPTAPNPVPPDPGSWIGAPWLPHDTLGVTAGPLRGEFCRFLCAPLGAWRVTSRCADPLEPEPAPLRWCRGAQCSPTARGPCPRRLNLVGANRFVDAPTEHRCGPCSGNSSKSATIPAKPTLQASRHAHNQLSAQANGASKRRANN